MLTGRGFWLLVTAVALIGAGIVMGSAPAVLVCLTVLLWFLFQWFLFQWRCRLAVGGLRVERVLHTARGAVDSIWAGQQAEVRVALTCDAAVMLPFVVAADRVP